MNPRLNVFDFRKTARNRLARLAFDYLEGGADDEVTMRRDRDVLTRMVFNPTVLKGIRQVDLSKRLFGREYGLPLVIGPVGFCGLFWPRGDSLLARAAGRAAIPYVLPTLSTTSIEEIPEVAGSERWFQVYAFQDEGRTADLIARAQSAGYKALVLTVDVPISGNRESSARHGANLPMRITLPFVWDLLCHPHWSLQMLHCQPRLENLRSTGDAKKKEEPFYFDNYFKRSISWEDVTRIRKLWKGTFILKGIQCRQDACEAVQAGVDGIVISNHGGWQLDGSPSAIEVLPEVVTAVKQQLTIMVDSGFRRGSDLIKAIALGADAVWLGRAPVYGLAACGEQGIIAVLTILRQEMERTMVLLGVDRLCQLHPDCLRR